VLTAPVAVGVGVSDVAEDGVAGVAEDVVDAGDGAGDVDGDAGDGEADGDAGDGEAEGGVAVGVDGAGVGRDAVWCSTCW
jgi:hypothetical protein